MQTTYRMKAAELDEKFLTSVKSLFGESEVEISIFGRSQAEEDETTYLLKTAANRRHLLEAVADVEAGRNLVTVSRDQLEALKCGRLSSGLMRSKTSSNGRMWIANCTNGSRR